MPPELESPALPAAATNPCTCRPCSRPGLCVAGEIAGAGALTSPRSVGVSARWRWGSVASVPSQDSSHDAVVEATADTERTMQPQRVPINVYEATGALVVVCPLPAVTADDVTVELAPGTLRFWARLRSAPPKEYLVHEWEYGGYEREVELPEGFGGGVEATLANGQLAVRVLRGAADDVIKITPSAL